MTKHLLLLLFITTSFFANSSELTEDELKNVYSLTKTNLDSAYTLSYELLKNCSTNDDYFGLVKLNYLLGFLHKKDGNIGKSVLHYLEAIRYAEKADYDNVRLDEIDIQQNLANLYRVYKANELAIEYYTKAIEIADWVNNPAKVRSLKFNLALTYEQANQIPQSISLFKELLPISAKDRQNRIINELGLIYWKEGDIVTAKSYFSQLLSLDKENILYKAKALQNLGEIEYESGNYVMAISLINEAIEIKNQITDVDSRSLFISYKILGDLHFKERELDLAQKAYKSAESLVSAVKHESFSFELYRSLSQLSYEFGNQIEGRSYSHLYSTTVDQYLSSQQTLQETDRQFNMDLITKRYLDQVAKQEQIASILFYSKIISGSLLALLLFTIGLNWYQKVQLRKSIVRDLINLKVVD